MKKAIAIQTLNNFDGIAIFDIEYGINDYIISAFHDGTNYDRAYKSKVYYDDNNGFYFKRYGNKYYLKDFMRI